MNYSACQIIYLVTVAFFLKSKSIYINQKSHTLCVFMGLGYSAPFSQEQMAAAKLAVQKLIQSNRILIFSAPFHCPYCEKAKALLASHKAIVHVPSNEEHQALEEITGQGSYPNIWINGTFIGGCNDGPENWHGLTKILKTGKFEELLNAKSDEPAAKF